MPSPASPSQAAPSRTVYAVSELNELLRALVEDSLPSLWVEGEISNFAKPASGHWYFTLKDARAQIRCAMFRNANYLIRPVPANGDAVLVRARAGVYPARGELQLIVEHLEPAGTGALLRAYEELKQRLAAEGLFDTARKRPLPARPRRIGLITSGTGAAVHDVLTTLARRWPLAEVCLYPVPVQGAEAPPAIVKALAELPQRAPGVELILLVRGGGSLEDLWAFNDERVARAIRACAVPVVSGVGHEVDVTIADFAADLRAATPTAAAEHATPDIAELRARVPALATRLALLQRRRIDTAAQNLKRVAGRLERVHPARRLQERVQRLDELSMRLTRLGVAATARAVQRLDTAERRLRLADPARRLAQLRPRLDALQQRLGLRLQTQLAARAARLQTAAAVLASLNPRGVLQRGYAILRDEQGHIVREAGALTVGQRLEAQLANGRISAEVRSLSPGPAPENTPTEP